MPYASVDGVEVYYERAGAGAPVLLLHGGFCTTEMMRPQSDLLSDRFDVTAAERPGHGRTADADGPMTYERSLGDTLAFMDAIDIGSAHVVGFSDGAIIGLLLALRHPERIRSLVAISGNLDPTGVQGHGEEPDPEDAAASDADAEEPDAEEPDEGWLRLRARYDAVSPDGPEHADVVLDKLLRMWSEEPHIDAADLAALALPVMVVAGDRDVIRPEHTRLIAESIPGAHLFIVPGTGHALLEERPALVGFALGEFLDSAAKP